MTSYPERQLTRGIYKGETLTGHMFHVFAPAQASSDGSPLRSVRSRPLYMYN